ncbi:MAG: 4-hydroxy-3-methylbut-2-enyl diphosphate reductase [Candidatus Tectomicrobia bacterium]|uniref:4-hydroxy-3-methylbut-2-enyl diphosphate reductase n=1 Tax=Tectimicrobiota bacterium TaxID=2528274 RepID=A0A933GKG0_UNCTE|nr:4-hydroxy-3-methylbut-2-enyl diphosphate reductase [Candidatus Tectomicrobia bacterium]
MGVQRATSIVLTLLNKGEKNIRTLGPLIHNPQAISLLESKGVKVIEDLEDANSVEDIVVIRAHGVPPGRKEEMKVRNLRIKDATCPKVLNVQSIIRKHVKQGYQAIIIGDKEHPEIIGLQGFAGTSGHVISSIEDLNKLPEFEKICVVAQTTQSEEKFLAISEKLKEKAKESLIFNTICESTNRRQAEIKELAKKTELLIIIGGKNSGNTKRLAEIAESTGTPTLQIESERELKARDFRGKSVVGVSAGASTPSWVIEKVIYKIRQLGGTGDEKID